MEDSENIIVRLKGEIKARDKDIHLAATYGKQLFEEKAELSSKVDDLISQKEVLEQEKHSLQLELEIQTQTVNSQTAELEFQNDRAEDFLEKFQASVKENEVMHKKIQNLMKENLYFKKVQDDLNVENESLKAKMNLQDRQIKNFQDHAEKSLCETEKEETQELQAQLNTYMLNNKEIQDALSQMQRELEIAKKNENHLLQMVKDLEEAVSDRDAEIRNYSAEVKKTKEDMEELQGEIEVLKFDQVDTNRRGNSVFAELDDRRNMVEREYKLLLKKFEHFQKTYEENKKELDRSRGQMAILQSMASREYQQTYIDKLEDSLSSAQREINELTIRLSKAIRSNMEVNGEEHKVCTGNEYDYLRVMLKQSQKKEKELQNEVLNLRSKNMYDNERLTETQHHVYKAKQDLDNMKQEVAKLKLKVKEMEQGIFQEKCSDTITRKPNTEVYEGFKPLSTKETSDKLKKSPFKFAHDVTIIPEELELDDDSFRQVKPARKSNKFILQEFNRVKEDEESCEKSSVPTTKKIEPIKNDNIVKELNDQNEKLKFTHKSRSKASKNDNCAQQ